MAVDTGRNAHAHYPGTAIGACVFGNLSGRGMNDEIQVNEQEKKTCLQTMM